MRVVAITTSYPRDADDFAGRFVHDLNVGLVQQGCEVTTLCPAAPGSPSEEVTEAGTVVRVPYGDDDLFYGDGLEANWKRARRPWRALRSWMRATTSALRSRLEGDELVIPHWLWPSGIPAVRGSRPKQQLIGVGHGGDLHLLNRPVVGRFLSRSLRGRFSGALVTSPFGRDVVRRRLGVARIRVAPMGVDPDRFSRRHDPPTWPAGYALGVGRLLPIKGFDILVRAAAKARIPLVIAGEGPEREALATIAGQSGGTLHLVGQLAPEDVARAMQHACAVAVPSREIDGGRSEGCPVVAVEALVAGTPVIASNTGGLPSLLPATALVPPEDVDALARMLESPPPPCAIDEVPLTRGETARVLLSLAND